MIVEIVEKEVAAAAESNNLGNLANAVARLFETTDLNALTHREVEELGAALSRAASLPVHDDIAAFHLETITDIHFDLRVATYS